MAWVQEVRFSESFVGKERTVKSLQMSENEVKTGHIAIQCPQEAANITGTESEAN